MEFVSFEIDKHMNLIAKFTFITSLQDISFVLIYDSLVFYSERISLFTLTYHKPGKLSQNCNKTLPLQE
jgi:hypothetical protein